ncbi:MAG: DNA gyrase subunit A [Oscillospiraceae bacterium]
MTPWSACPGAARRRCCTQLCGPQGQLLVGSIPRDMAYAASRYTEAKLDAICQELFRDMDFDTVDMVDNYDGTMKEPTLMPTTFPNVLVSANTGIAVGMASNICGFQPPGGLRHRHCPDENPDHDILETMPAPDFPTGGEPPGDPMEMRTAVQDGSRRLQVRALKVAIRFPKEGESHWKSARSPYATTAEAILDKVSELIRAGKIREIGDMRDETDLSGLKLTIDLKRGADPEQLTAKALPADHPDGFLSLQLQHPHRRDAPGYGGGGDSGGVDRMAQPVRETPGLLPAGKEAEKLHLLKGLERILLDIDSGSLPSSGRRSWRARGHP